MKLYSWNVNGIRAVIKKGELHKFFESYKPDTVGLQEIKAHPDQFELHLDGYDYYYYNPAERKGYSGTAIISKIPALSIQNNFSAKILQKYNFVDKYGDISTEGRVLAAEFEDFYFVTVYTPNCKEDLSRLKLRADVWDRAFLDFMLELQLSKPVIFCGDTNVAHNEIDLANPKANRGKHGFTDEERAGFGRFIENNFADTFRLFNQQPEQYSWWSNFGGARSRNVGWRIDYFVTSQDLKAKLKGAYIHPSQMGSDHCPVSIEIDL
jgi:exodeoxyribonuclease III